MIVAHRLTRFGGEGLARFLDQLDRLLIQTDHRAFGVIRTPTNFQNIFHVGDERGILRGWNHPTGALMRLEFVF